MNVKQDNNIFLSIFLIIVLGLLVWYFGFSSNFLNNSSNSSWENENDTDVKITTSSTTTTSNTSNAINNTENTTININNSTTSRQNVSGDVSGYIVDDAHSMKVNDKYTLVNKTNKKLSYKSDNYLIATVNSNGVVTAKSEGSVVIYATDDQGNSDYIRITVLSNVKYSFVIQKNDITLLKDNQYTIEYNLIPNSDSISWSSSDSKVAKVSSSGIITAIKKGKAVITGITGNGNKDTIVVTVTEPMKYFIISNTSLTLDVNQSYKLLIQKNIAGTVKWSSSNKSVATVDSSGLVTAKDEGTATITASLDGNKTSCKVIVRKVVKRVNGVSVSKSSVKLDVGNTVSITATISPSDATNKSVTWKSENTNIATVSSTGKITAISPGTTRVSVTSVDNEKTAYVQVTVNPILPTNLYLKSPKSELIVGDTITLSVAVSPANATNKNVTFSSSDSSIASVNSSGKVTALKAGTVKIVGKTVSGGISSSVTLSVISPKTFTVSFNPNGASGSTTKATCTTYGSSCSVTAPSITRSGFNIVGWNTNKNATTASAKVKTSITVSSDTTYYAITNKKVTATFNKNTITGDISIESTSKNCTINNNKTSCSIQLPSITRSGFSILGWSTSSSATSGTAVGKNVSISSNTNYYAITKLNADGNIIGATGYSALGIYLYKSASTSSSTILTLKAGVPFTILSETNGYWYVLYNGNYGYVINKYCMINLPDYIPSITYDIKDSYSSTLKSSGYNIPNVTGKKLYNFGKTYNNRLKKEEFIVPLLYDVAKKVLSAQKAALKDGYSLKVYDAYRPRSISTLLSKNLTSLYNSNSTVRNNIDYSVGASGTKYYWGQGWFLANGLSTHNVGAAVDISMTNKGSTADLSMPSNMNEVSTLAIKYYSSSVSHVAANYSKGMLNSSAAQRMHTYMINAGLTDLASEWWHFQNNDSYNRIKELQSNGCDFTPQGLASQ